MGSTTQNSTLDSDKHPTSQRPSGQRPIGRGVVEGATIARSRRLKNSAATIAMAAAFLVAAAPLLIMSATVVAKGAKVVATADWWTSPIPGDVGRADLAGNPTMCRLGFGDPVACEQGEGASSIVKGMQPAIVGTLLTVVGASVLAVPVGVMGAVYLNEYGKKNRLARTIRFMTEVMVGVPSVVMGVFVYSIWVIRFGTAGKSAFAASLALACLMLPIVVRSTEEMLRLVPDSLREASAALGTRTWKTTVKVVLPAAVAGIVSGCLLAVARAAGETAPVVFTIGFVTTTNWSFTGQNTTLSAQIYSQLQNGGSVATQLAWGSAVTLVVIVLFLTIAARFATRRLTAQ
ncbi:MAG: phosphate ABC transporter permease PstA [Microthrixaceae bacterium]